MDEPISAAASESTDACDLPTTTGPTTDRRTLLRRPRSAFLAAAGGSAAVAACEEASASTDGTSVLLRRLTYGATRAARDHLDTVGPVAWLDEQLDPAALARSGFAAKVAEWFPALAMSADRLQSEFPTTRDATDAIGQLRVATLLRAVESPAQLHERMVEFWSDHFNIAATGALVPLLKIVEDRTVMRRHALGRFKDLLVADASSPAMLVYLDNAVSRRGAINENYGRELLELHTLGHDNGYRYRDIVETARLFTGWTVDASGEFVFRAAWHDPGPVRIMGWTRPPTGGGHADGVAFLHWLAMRPQTATHVCRKLAVRFVGDDPPPGLVEAMARTWLAQDSRIVPVIRTMVAHPSFAVAAPKFQRPFDFLVRLLRVLDARVSPRRHRRDDRPLGHALTALGQLPFAWPAPDGYPDTEADWLSTGGLLARWNLVGDVLAGALDNVSFDGAALRTGLDGLSAREIHDRTADRLVLPPPSTAARAVLRAQTGWSDRTRPTPSEIDARLPVVLLAGLVAPEAQFR